MLDTEKINEIIETEYSDYLKSKLSCISKSIQNDGITPETLEKFVVNFTACYVSHHIDEKHDSLTINSDMLYDAVNIANTLYQAEVNVKINEPALEQYQKLVSDICGKYNISKAADAKTIQHEDLRIMCIKELDKAERLFQKQLKGTDKTMTYHITENKYGNFLKKVERHYDDLSRDITYSKMSKCFGPKDTGSVTDYEASIRELMSIYDIVDVNTTFKYLRHMFVNVKRNINRMSISCPQMYCFCGSGENSGKTSLCNSIYRVTSLQNNTTDENKNNMIVQNLNFGNLVSRFSSPEYYKYPIIHVDERRFFQDNEEEILKNIITSPMISIERKGRDTETVENHSTIIVSMNDGADMIMHNNTKERRRAIIEFSKKDDSIKKNMTSIELDALIYKIMTLAPTEYYYDPKEVDKLAESRTQNDGILEAMMSSADFKLKVQDGGWQTASCWVQGLSDGSKVSATFFRNYMSRHPEYFEEREAHHGAHFFRPTQELKDIMNEDLEQD